jgi:hypothetical protein
MEKLPPNQQAVTRLRCLIKNDSMTQKTAQRCERGKPANRDASAPADMEGAA